MDFYEVTNKHLPELNNNERRMFDYVIRNIRKVQDMSVRALANECYVSTTTIIRFVKKLGFNGYRDFSQSIRLTCSSLEKSAVPDVIWKENYSEAYLKNIIESVRVISSESVKRFVRHVKSGANITFFGRGLSREVAQYAYFLFTSIGCNTYLPMQEFEVRSAIDHSKDNDIIFLFSMSGETTELIRIVEEVSLRCKPVVVSITWSGNNTIQNLSDIDFYVFSDQMRYKNADLASRISMIAIVEMLAYSLLEKEK